MLRVLIFVPVMLMSGLASGQDAAEAGNSCVVVHQQDESDADAVTTCFENIALERTSFESGVCQWKTDAQAAQQVRTTTTFVPHCPTTYTGYCDLLVLGPQMVAPVKIFLYDRSEDVLERARAQCLSGGGQWHKNDDAAD